MVGGLFGSFNPILSCPVLLMLLLPSSERIQSCLCHAFVELLLLAAAG